jgi:hypothetical protein
VSGRSQKDEEDEAAELEAEFEADLADLDAVDLDERVPAPPETAPAAQLALHQHLDQVVTAYQALSPDPDEMRCRYPTCVASPDPTTSLMPQCSSPPAWHVPSPASAWDVNCGHTHH